MPLPKVFFISHQSDLSGGASKSMLSVICGLRDTYGYKPYVLLPRIGQLSAALEHENIDFICARYYWWMGPKIKLFSFQSVKWIIKKVINYLSAWKLSFELKSLDIDLVYTNTSTVGFGFDLAKFLRVPHVFHVREFGEEDYNIWYLDSIKSVNKKLSASCNHIIVISGALYDKYTKVFGGHNTNLVYNGIADEFQANKIRLDSSSTESVVNFVVVGYLSEGKNQLDVIKAAESLKKISSKNFKIYFVGGGVESYVSSMHELVRQSDLSNEVFFVGELDKQGVNDLLAKSDVGIIPSKMEAFGRVTIEYMLASLPVIASNSGANPEIIDNTVTGLLYSPGDLIDLADKMAQLLNSDSQRRKLGQAGREKALERFSVSANIDCIHRVITKAIS